MNRCLFLVLVVSGYCHGQSEFEVYSNGLIYDNLTMKKLSTIVDSLNIKFRMCDLTRSYFSLLQGLVTHVNIPSKEALKLIRRNLSLEEYLKAYPENSVQRVWITKSRYTNYKGVKYIEYQGLPSRNSQPTIKVKDNEVNDKTSGWVVDEDKEDAFYINKLESQELPVAYARLVQYVDCMIDTTAEIYLPQAKAEGFQRVSEDSKANAFVKWAESYPGKPEMVAYEEIEKRGLKSDSVYSVYRDRYHKWDSLRMIDLDQRLKAKPHWKDLLAEAVNESIETGNSDERLEFYAARYLSKEATLQLMRSRKVIGNCSMDQSPRYHAMNICKLSAETTKWDIFLRSHLDIMNDRFDRRSDGSYAWAGRKTYLKELEQLDIKVEDLLLGTCLRVQNVSSNHYWGSIGRVGRALADASDKDELENRLVSMMKDRNLDIFNRMLTIYLLDNYLYNLEDEARKKQGEERLESAISEMPDFIKAVWKQKER
jgi:hypothetical protein